MGGKKKLSISQMERIQVRREKEAQRRKGRSSRDSFRERDSTGIYLPNLKSKETLNELKRLKVLTPYAVASRFGVRLSVAKDFLEQLESKGLIEFVSRSRKIKIYKIAA